MLTPIYLTDDDGNKIEQTSGSGDYIIIGYIDSALFADTSGELRNTFLGIVQAASVEEKAEVLRGLRLAKSLRGRLNRFELSGTTNNAYVKYNHSIFGGRFQSQFTALGAIAGTYLRRGGSAFTKELVEAALVQSTDPFARFNTFPSSPALPGEQTFSVSAGNADTISYSWSIDDGAGNSIAIADPTQSSVTVTLTEATWNVNCLVGLDSVPTTLSSSFEVANLGLTGAIAVSADPAVGQPVDIAFPVNSNSLLGDIDWSFKVELAASQRVDLTPGVDYVVNSENTNTINVTFLTAGAIETTAVIRNANGDVATTQANIDVADLDTPNTVTDHSILSQATADALVQGDTHLIILGDSLMNPISQDRFRRGLVDSWKPARWAGIQPAAQTGAATSGNNNEHDLHYWASSSVIRNAGSGSGSANVRRDGTNGSVTVMDTRLAHRVTMESSFTQLESEGAGIFRIRTLGRSMDSDILRGRLQSADDHFYRQSSLTTRALFYNLDGTPTLRATADDASGADEVITMSPNSYTMIDLPRDASAETSGNYQALNVSFDSINSGDTFGVMDSFIYSPLVSGLSVSYCGHGGWCTTQHSGDPVRVSARPANQPNQYFDDEACVEHLRMVAFKDKAQTQLRDNIFILLEIQNNSRTHDSQMREDLLPILTRWNNAADVVDPSGNLRAQLKMIVMSLVDIIPSNQHDELAVMMPNIVGLGGYEQVEFIDLYNAVKQFDGGIYANPADYSSVASGGNGSISPTWYDNGDRVHPVLEGSRKIMEIFWSVVTDAAADPTGFSFTINTPSGGTTDDTYNYTLSGSLPADRLVTWYVDDVETASGDAFTLPAVEGTFVVKATVNGSDGASATVTAPAVSIVSPNASPAFTIQPRLEDDEEPIVEGGVVPIEFRAIDADGDTLEYFVDGQSVGTFTQNTTVTANVTAGSAGVLQTVNVTVSDGVAPALSATPLTFTPASANTAPSIGTFSTGAGPFTEGDTVSLAASSIADAENDTLTYAITLTIDGASQPGTVASGTVPVNGVVVATNVAATAGSYVYTLTVTDTDGASDTETASITVDPAGSATRIGTILFGDNGDNINEPDDNGAVKVLFATLSAAGGNLLHFSVIDAGPGSRFQINTTGGFREDTAMTAFGNGINDGTYEWRIDDGSGSYYRPTSAQVVSVSTSNTRIEFTNFVDSSGTSVAQSVIDARIAANSNVEVWEM